MMTEQQIKNRLAILKMLEADPFAKGLYVFWQGVDDDHFESFDLPVPYRDRQYTQQQANDLLPRSAKRLFVNIKWNLINPFNQNVV